MGLLSHLISYKIGKSRGKKTARKEHAERQQQYDERDPDCLNYAIFCRNFGSCDGQQCEYDD